MTDDLLDRDLDRVLRRTGLAEDEQDTAIYFVRACSAQVNSYANRIRMQGIESATEEESRIYSTGF